MKAIDIIVIVFVVAIVGILIYNAVVNKKKKGPGCGCSSCSTDCPLYNADNADKKQDK